MSINPKKYIDVDSQDTPIIIYRDKNVVVESLEVNPKSYNQVFEPGEDVDGFAPVTVTAVNSSVDRNIKPENIKQGVSILGVAGEINALVGQEKSVSPTTSQQTVRPDDGYNGLTSVTVRAVNSSIDSAIQAGNIKSGVTILGVSGNVTELNGQEVEITPTTAQQIIEPTDGANGITRATVSAVTASIDSNIQAQNIVSGVSILGVTGNYTPSKYGITFDAWVGNPVGGKPSTAQGSGTPNFVGVTNMSNYWLAYKFNGNQNITGVASFPDLTEISGNGCLTGAFSGTQITSLSMPNLKTVSGPYAFSYVCNHCSSLTSVDFSSLETITGQEAFRNAFNYCTALTSVSFSSLKTINASYVFMYVFSDCDHLTTVSFPALETITGGSIFDNAFRYCTALTSVSFAKLSSASNTQFTGMLVGCSNVTVHFPAAMQSTMGSWTSVQNGFGGTNTAVLFDL